MDTFYSLKVIRSALVLGFRKPLLQLFMTLENKDPSLIGHHAIINIAFQKGLLSNLTIFSKGDSVDKQTMDEMQACDLGISVN